MEEEQEAGTRLGNDASVKNDVFGARLKEPTIIRSGHLPRIVCYMLYVLIVCMEQLPTYVSVYSMCMSSIYIHRVLFFN